jgi:CubicO group peptidase (beta-lactamase class C family)
LLCQFLFFAQQRDFKQLHTYVQKSQETWNIHGIAITIINDGKVVFSMGNGIREFGKPGKITDETLFAIAPNTKAFTESAIILSVEQGVPKLGDPVQKYLPWFKLCDPNVSANISIRDLLCHLIVFQDLSGYLMSKMGNLSLIFYHAPFMLAI